MNGPRVSLEQWRALISVVESGGYAQAAQAIHKSQSAVSHAVQRLEALLGVEAFRVEGRRAVLTEAGQVLYRRGRGLLAEAQRLEQAAADLARGWEAELRIAAEITFPTWLLLQAMARLSDERPDLRVDLTETVLGGSEEALNSGVVDLAIVPRVPPGFLGDPLVNIEFICAAHPDHPLHQLGRPLTLDDLRPHRHLVIRDSAQQQPMRMGLWLNENRWRVTNKATSIRAACLGLGFAWFPEPAIRAELRAGDLKPLPLRDGGTRRSTLYLVFNDPDTTGPGARRLASILREELATGTVAAA